MRGDFIYRTCHSPSFGGLGPVLAELRPDYAGVNTCATQALTVTKALTGPGDASVNASLLESAVELKFRNFACGMSECVLNFLGSYISHIRPLSNFGSKFRGHMAPGWNKARAKLS